MGIQALWVHNVDTLSVEGEGTVGSPEPMCAQTIHFAQYHRFALRGLLERRHRTLSSRAVGGHANVVELPMGMDEVILGGRHYGGHQRDHIELRISQQSH